MKAPGRPSWPTPGAGRLGRPQDLGPAGVFDRWLAAAKPDELAASAPAEGLRLATSVPTPGASIVSRFELADAGDFEKDHAFSYGVWIKLPRGKKTGAVLARMETTGGHRGWDIWLEGNRVATHILHKWPDDRR